MVGDAVCYNDVDTVAVDNNCEAIPERPMLNFRPHGGLARALYEKQMSDNFLSSFDKNQWYHCELDRMPQELASKFVQLGPDEDTVLFLQRSEEKSDWVPTQIWHSVAKAFLGWFMTQTSINGWLRRGSMFVLSFPQLLKLLGPLDPENFANNTNPGAADLKSKRWRSLLDLGAGDGEVTAHFAPLFQKTYVTEVSGTMRAILQNRGYEVLEVDSWYKDGLYDVISCLNLLDRCNTPNTILGQIKAALKPDGLLILALVLPFSAYVESGTRDHKPHELLPVEGATFEDQVQSVVQHVIKPLDFQVVSWTRVPYLCEGDLQQSYYWLDDVVFVLKNKKRET